MSELLWTDPQDRVIGGQKRHAYRSREVNDRTVYARVCGTPDRTNHGVVRNVDGLNRVDSMAFARDPNACAKCLRALELDTVAESVKRPGGGAESVEYDPFGVFTQKRDESADEGGGEPDTSPG